MKITYCDKWSILKKGPWNLIDKAKARENHTGRIPYTAIIQDNYDNVTHVIEITDKYLLVNFMNKFTSPYLCYNFIVKDSDNIFLSAAYCTSYDEKSNRELLLMNVSFKENGDVVMERRDLVTGDVDERENKMDPKRNWDKYPEFGSYNHLLVEER